MDRLAREGLITSGSIVHSDADSVATKVRQWRSVLTGMQHFKGLNTLSLRGTQVNPPAGIELAWGLHAATSLRRLRVVGLRGAESGTHLCAALMHSAPQLTDLTLEGCRLVTNAVLKNLAAALLRMGQLQRLAIIDAGIVVSHEGALALASALPSLQHMRELTLDIGPFDKEAAKHIGAAVRAGEHLQTVYLCCFDDPLCLEPVARALAGGGAPLLRELVLGRYGMGDCIMDLFRSSHMWPSLENLSALTLSDSGLSDAGAMQLAVGLPTLSKLHTLWLEDNAIGDAGVAALASMQASFLAQLQHLDLSGNPRVGDSGATALAGAVGSMISLRNLNLSSCSLSCSGMRQVIKALCGATQLVDVEEVGMIGCWGDAFGDATICCEMEALFHAMWDLVPHTARAELKLS
jgi:hypothetical protein